MIFSGYFLKYERGRAMIFKLKFVKVTEYKEFSLYSSDAISAMLLRQFTKC